VPASGNPQQLTANNQLATINSKTYIFSCTSSVCKDTTGEGYFLTSGSSSAKELFYCDSSNNCDKKTQLNAAYYPEGKATGGKYTSLIKCESSKCETATGTAKSYYGFGEGATTPSGGSLTYKKLIYCSDASTCEIVAEPKKGYYLGYADANSKIKNLINCTADKSCVDLSSQNTNYIDASTSGNVIKCNGSSECTSGAGVKTPGHAYIDSGSIPTGKTDATKVILCDDSGCSSVNYAKAANSSKNKPAYNIGFMNEGSDTTNNLIICTSTKCETKQTGVLGQAIIDGSSYDEDDDVFTNLITCTAANTCTSLAGSSPAKQPSTLAGHAYIDIGSEVSGTPSKYPKLIQCSEDGCEIINGEEKTTGKAYIDGTQASPFAKLISCTGGTCTSGAGSASNNSFYIDGTDNEKKNYIVCTTTACESKTAITDDDTVDKYYLDTQNTDKYISCSQSTGECQQKSITSQSGESKYYVDGHDETKVLKCTNGSACVEEAGVSAAGQAYIDGAVSGNVIICTTDSETSKVTCASQDSGASAATTGTVAVKPAFLDASSSGTGTDIILCTKTTTASCTSTTYSSFPSGHAFLDGTSLNADGKFTNLIVSDGSKFEALAAESPAETPSTEAGHVYIDEGTGETPSGGGTAVYKNIIRCESTGCTVMAGIDGTNSGMAYIDAVTQTNIISCPSNSCSSTAGGASSTGVAYVDGLTPTNIISCATSCVSAPNGSAEAADGKEALNKFYINGNTKTKIIVCTSKNGCSSIDGVAKTTPAATVDNYYPDSQNKDNILLCNKDGTTDCTTTSHKSTAGGTPTYYLDGYTNEKILKCEADSICEEITGISTPGYGYVDEATDGHVIVCEKNDGKTACSSIDNGSKASPVTITGFIDADVNDAKSILKCSDPSTKCTPTVYTATQGHAFLDGSSADNGVITNLIVTDTTKGTFAALAASDKKPKTEVGYVYIDASTPANVIQCTLDNNKVTCTTEAGLTGKEFGYIDGSNDQNKKVITCVSGCESKDNESKAEENKVPINQFFINGKDKSKIVACTSSNGCSVITGNEATEGNNKYYPDSQTKDNVITCVPSGSSAKDKCTSGPHAGSQNDAYYIDGYTPKYVLLCNKTGGCVSSKNLATADQPSHYVDAGGASGKPVIITCTTENCTSGGGNTTEGSAYLDPTDTKNVIICKDSKKACEAPKVGVIASTSDTYIDAGNEAQIIYCTATACNYFKSKPSDGTSEYYARFSTDVKEIIECDYNSTATNKSTCKLDKKTAIAKNSVYKNYLFGKENGDATNPLIICSANGCKPSIAKITNNKKSYYINSDVQSVDRKLNGDIIECTEASKECKILAGSDTDVYLNANYDASANKKEVIICRSGEGCLEQKTNSTTTDFRYYVNAGSTFKKALNDTLIECKDTCQVLTTVKDGEIYINEFDTSQTIQCYEEKGCTAIKSQATDKKNEIFLNSSNLNKSKGTEPTGNEPLKNDLIKCVYEEGKITCSAKDGQADEVYVNSHNTTEIIYCKSDGCTTKASEALTTQPEYYINADPTDEEKLDGDLIKCKNTGTKITCEVTKGGDGDVYLNANVENDSNNKPLIICTKENGCLTDTSKATSSESLPAYYVNSGSVLSAKLNDTLIECNFGTATADCDIKQAVANDVYRNYGNNTETHQLIKCTTNGCKVAISSATEKSNEYYLNAGDKEEKALDYDIIECSNDGDSVECTELQKTGEGVYINSNYSENGDSNQLILCSSDNGCEGIKTSAKGNEYYVNAEANDLNNAIIFCSNKKCEKQTPIDIPTYYVGTTQEGEVNGLIECTKSEVVADTTTTTNTNTNAASRRKRATEEKCKLKLAFTSNGYFLNAGYNKSVNQTIICDSTDGCETQNVDLGYYVNAGDDTKPIIKCEKEGSECYSEESDSCPQTSDAVAGNYCYEEGLLKFFPEGNSTAIAASKSDDIYTFATIPSGGFPGIKSETGALFKISRYFINRFYQSGIVMIDKNGKLVDNLSSADQSEISLYDCNDSTKTCTLRAGCTSNTYMYDSENKKAVFCNSGKLEYAEFTGYVVDGYRMVGTNHPYIIECQNNGNNCKSIKPKVSSYYENSGYDSSSNSLIECYSNNCVTKTADVGYYVGHEGEGIIQCTSSTSCNYTKSKSKVKYVNAGYNKSSSAIISCAKNSCSAVKAEIGYYLTYINTLLIYCSSPFNCVEFTPTVNYFENADSTESSSTIINCDQNSQVVTCALEATGNGFYLSNSPNELILCKSGNKCKTVKVKNGIFSSAVKSPSTKGNRRSNDDDDVELSEDGNSVTIPRDSDDSYNIIRCVQEKCSALSPSEVAAIPICEFNNNKCYITLEYAMTKSATTSITAGNICTNADRSIFYFATDTIVVKPNVISGVTATYVYTTTNSNCLEVNDSYSDMYFTVGSNIYLLDQGSVLQFYEQGYYFINTAKNSIVSGNDIDSYNDENVKLYKCNGSSCSIMDKPDSLTYYADVNKRIIRYNVNSDSYSFAYDKDITCIFANNKCTPNADLKNQEFCITYKGELALATADIKNRETGECYKASTISSNIYGYSQYLYSMNVYSAQMIDETGYYIISLSTNTTVVSKNYKTKNNNLVIYGCQLSSCKVIEPEEDTYYYDSNAKTILRYKDGVWKTPDTSGYAYISIDPSNTYIYRFTKNLEEVKINAMANYGYYYTVDGEMYHCDRDEDGDCSPIDNTGYYFTNAGEVYYCVHDSEEIEPTECTKQACVSGQYYYIEDAYYRCESSSTLVPVMSRFCSYNDNVIVNFPIALTEEYPEKIKQAVEGIEKNNNSTAIVSRRGKNYLESVSGIFTNCTYNVEETKSTFDLVCVNNFVTVDEETDDIKICSMEQLGYVECIEDEENPEKCNVSGGYARFTLSIITIIVASLFSILLL